MYPWLVEARGWLYVHVWLRAAGYETKDWLGILGFFIATSNLIYSRLKDRREPLRSDICKSIDEFRSLIVLLSDDVEKHLCCEEGKKSRQDIYRADKRAKEVQHALDGKLPICQRRLFALYTEFWQAISDDGFPCERPEDKFTRSSDRVSRVIKARTAIVAYLDEVRAGCFTGGVKYWKKKGDFLGSAPIIQ